MKNLLYIKSYIRNPKPIFDMILYHPWDFFIKTGVLFSNLFKIVSRAHMLTQNTYSVKFWQNTVT